MRLGFYYSLQSDFFSVRLWCLLFPCVTVTVIFFFFCGKFRLSANTSEVLCGYMRLEVAGVACRRLYIPCRTEFVWCNHGHRFDSRGVYGRWKNFDLLTPDQEVLGPRKCGGQIWLYSDSAGVWMRVNLTTPHISNKMGGLVGGVLKLYRLSRKSDANCFPWKLGRRLQMQFGV